MSLTAKEVAQILQALEQSSFDTLDLDLNGVKLHLRRGGGTVREPESQAPSPPAAPTTVPHPAPTPPATLSSTRIVSGATPVAAPLLGIFYRAPRPGEAPFVQVGDRVTADTVIGIIEVMKLMNSVHAGIEGEIVDICAGNGELVEYGQPLLWVRVK